MTTYAEYGPEIDMLSRLGWTNIRPAGTGGGCRALCAHKDGVYLLATDEDHGLAREHGRRSGQWLVSLERDDDGDYSETYGVSESIATALLRALEVLEGQ